MSRNIVQTMELIFDTLKKKISEEDEDRIIDIKRHIKADGDEKPVMDFVKYAKMQSFKIQSENICLFKYKDELYLLTLDKYTPSLNEIGFEIETDKVITQGTGMLAMASDKIPLNEDISSLSLIENVLE